MNKKGQLGIIEFKFMLIGLAVGIILTLLVIYLSNIGVIPFKLAFLCPGK